MRSNCLVYALSEWYKEHRAWRAAGRRVRCEPRILVRSSRLYPRWVPHFEVGIPVPCARGLHLMTRGYVPLDETPLPWYLLWRALWFRGRVAHNE